MRVTLPYTLTTCTLNLTPRLSMLILLGVTLSIGPDHRLGHVPPSPPGSTADSEAAFGKIKHPARSRRSTHRYIHIHSDIELAPRGRRHRVERKRGAVTRFDRNESVTFTNTPPKFPPELQLAPRIHDLHADVCFQKAGAGLKATSESHAQGHCQGTHISCPR